MILTEIIKNQLGLSSLPSFCTYLVTWQCNAKCQMCDVWKKHKNNELTLSKIKSIFQQLKRLDALRISGGEPFLRKDLPEIVNIVQKYNKPKLIHITSNGLLTDRIVSFIKQCQKTDNIHIKISIDAFGKKHDQIRGIPGAYKKATNTLKQLSKLKNSRKFYLGVNQTIIDNQGLKDYQKLSQALAPLKIKVHPVVAQGQTALYTNQENLNLFPKKANECSCYFEFSKQEMSKLIALLQKEADSLTDFKEKLVKKYYLKGLYNRLVLNKDKPNPPCVALKNHLRILPNGDVPICLFNSQIAGNLKRETIRKLWFGQEIKKYRDLAKKCPGCWVGCETIPNAVYSGDLVKDFFKF